MSAAIKVDQSAQQSSTPQPANAPQKSRQKCQGQDNWIFDDKSTEIRTRKSLKGRASVGVFGMRKAAEWSTDGTLAASACQ